MLFYLDDVSLHLWLLYGFICFTLFSREDLEKAESTGNWKSVHAFYITAFDSFTELNAAFKVMYKRYIIMYKR